MFTHSRIDEIAEEGRRKVRFGYAKIIDFGIAISKDDPNYGSSVGGTPSYMPWEVEVLGGLPCTGEF